MLVRVHVFAHAIARTCPSPPPGREARASRDGSGADAQRASTARMPWHGILKLPSLHPQVGLTFELWPDSRAWLP